MVRVEVASGQESVHVERIDQEFGEVQARFNLVVASLLKKAPNALAGRQIRTSYNSEFPTNRRVTFDYQNARITASYYVNFGEPPSYDLRIETPIVINGLGQGFTDINHPLDPHEIVTFTSSLHYASIDIGAEAVTRFGDFGYRVKVADYTAGGLLPPIKTLGREKLQTIEAVTSLFKGVDPINPVYLQPLP